MEMLYLRHTVYIHSVKTSVSLFSKPDFVENTLELLLLLNDHCRYGIRLSKDEFSSVNLL